MGFLSGAFLTAWFFSVSVTSLAGYALGPWASGEHEIWSSYNDKPVSEIVHPGSSDEKKLIGRMSEWEISEVFESLRDAEPREKLEVWSSLFLNTPYFLDSLGEGYHGKRDPKPPLDFTRVDCLSFVEQVMALAFSQSYDEVLSWLLRIRYRGGKPKFNNRHYTMTKGWILANKKIGLLEDVTAQVVSADLLGKISVGLRPKSYWERQHRKRFQILGKHAPSGVARLNYIPIDALIQGSVKLPVSALMHIVSEIQHSSPYLITHTGLLVKKNNVVYFRHASRSPTRQRVEDRIVEEYLETLRDFYEKEGRRRVLGVNITRIIPPGEVHGKTNHP